MRAIAMRLVRSESRISTVLRRPTAQAETEEVPVFGRATADLPVFTRRRKRHSMNRLMLAMTRCPARSLAT